MALDGVTFSDTAIVGNATLEMPASTTTAAIEAKTAPMATTRRGCLRPTSGGMSLPWMSRVTFAGGMFDAGVITGLPSTRFPAQRIG